MHLRYDMHKLISQFIFRQTFTIDFTLFLPKLSALTALLIKRTLYCAKDAPYDSEHSITPKLDLQSRKQCD